MNLVEARAAVKARGFQYLDDATVTLMLNNAKGELEDYADWPWLETTTAAGPAPLTISDLRSVLYVLDTTNDVPLTGLDPRDIPEIAGDIDTAGTPQHWWLDGLTTLKVYPTSATTQLSVRYLKYSADLSSSGDEPSIPRRYHQVWIDLAVVEALKDDDQYQSAAVLRKDAEERLEDLLSVYSTRNHQGPDSMVMTWGSEDA